MRAIYYFSALSTTAMRIIRLFLILPCLLISSSFFGQDIFAEIKSPTIRQYLDAGHFKTEIFLKDALNKEEIPVELQFEFERSNIRGASKRNRYFFYFDTLKTISPDSVGEIWFAYTYRWQKIEQRFNVIFIPGEYEDETKFVSSRDEAKLVILDSLRNGACQTCIRNIDNYASQNKITDYYLMVEPVSLEGKIANRFVWSLVRTSGPHKGEATFVDPRTGKKTDMSKYLTAPRPR